MKAVINAGGKGTRARPFTYYFPKAMLPVNGKLLIEHIVNYLNSFEEISDILIIIDDSDSGKQIENFFEGKSQKYRTKLQFYKDNQEGTGGCLLKCKESLSGEKNFLLWFADNLSNLDIKEMITVSENSNSLGCIATRNRRKEETGFVKIKEGFIESFLEKPEIALPLPEALGIYIFDREIIAEIEEEKKKHHNVDLSFDILMKLKSKTLINYDIGDKEWIDLENPNKIERNSKTVTRILNSIYTNEDQ